MRDHEDSLIEAFGSDGKFTHLDIVRMYNEIHSAAKAHTQTERGKADLLYCECIPFVARALLELFFSKYTRQLEPKLLRSTR